MVNMEPKPHDSLFTKILPPLTSQIALALLLIVLVFVIIFAATKSRIDFRPTLESRIFTEVTTRPTLFAFISYEETDNTLTYHNLVYGFSFTYPTDSVIFSRVDGDTDIVYLPEDTKICVEQGPLPSGIGSTHDDPVVFCVEVYPDTNLDEYAEYRALMYTSEGSPLAIDFPGAQKAIPVIHGVAFQKGPHVIYVSGTYLEAFDYLLNDPPLPIHRDPTFSDNVFKTFTFD
jgi:hypothetical protein